LKTVDMVFRIKRWEIRVDLFLELRFCGQSSRGIFDY
jgi:hypothetical protein